jgi:hypothetical protein
LNGNLVVSFQQTGEIAAAMHDAFDSDEAVVNAKEDDIVGHRNKPDIRAKVDADSIEQRFFGNFGQLFRSRRTTRAAWRGLSRAIKSMMSSRSLALGGIVARALSFFRRGHGVVFALERIEDRTGIEAVGVVRDSFQPQLAQVFKGVGGSHTLLADLAFVSPVAERIADNFALGRVFTGIDCMTNHVGHLGG